MSEKQMEMNTTTRGKRNMANESRAKSRVPVGAEARQRIESLIKPAPASEKKLFEVTIRRQFSPEYQAKWRTPYNLPDHEESNHPEWAVTREDVAARWAKNHDQKHGQSNLYTDSVAEIREVPEAEVAERRAKLQSWHQACCALAVTTPCVCHVSYVCPVHGSRHVGTHD